MVSNLIFSKTESTVKHNSSFLIKSAVESEHKNQKIEKKSNISFIWTLYSTFWNIIMLKSCWLKC